MRHDRATILAFAFLAAFAVGARADDAQTAADLRCMAVMAKINQLPDPRHQLESLIGGYYYLGRLRVAAPGLDLGPSTADAYIKMSPADFLSETTRCEKEMRDQGQAISSIGAAMPKVPQNSAPPGSQSEPR
jgi:hypothetical protein